MSVPGIVQSTLDGEEIAANVSLGGEDVLFITPTRTLVYRSEGLLSDESVDEFPHTADRLTLSEGRRKTKFSLEYPLEGTKEFTIPASKTDVALHPVLAGVLTGNEITDPGETVVQTYRFSELTLIVTSERLVKHIGNAVWDEEYEEYHFSDVTNLSFEDGSVATQIVLEVDGRPERIKAPNDRADDLRERLKRTLFEYHEVGSLEELNALVEDEPEDDETNTMDFGDGVEPLAANPPEPDTSTILEGADPDDPIVSDTENGGQQAETDDPLASTSGHSVGSLEADTQSTDSAEPVETGDVFEQAHGESDSRESAADPELLERLEGLEAAVERQSTLIEAQQETIDQLIEELRRGR